MLALGVVAWSGLCIVAFVRRRREDRHDGEKRMTVGQGKVIYALRRDSAYYLKDLAGR